MIIFTEIYHVSNKKLNGTFLKEILPSLNMCVKGFVYCHVNNVPHTNTT